MANQTLVMKDMFPPPPFYYSSLPNLLPFISDKNLSLAAPIVAYWSLSLLFHGLDISGWKWLDRYRLHKISEATSRNRTTLRQVIQAVFLQQIIQTGLGWWWLSSEPENDVLVNHTQAIGELAPRVGSVLELLVGPKNAGQLLAMPNFLPFVYWWAIPAGQFALALFIIDTWQYFLHRLFHINKFLYRRFHSVHHELYVPYAFGALYNHWFEGLLLDTLGAAVAHSLSFMTIRQAVLLFTFSTFKTVDDHCGYALPFDPFQILFPNNSSYHDVHHEVWGIKYNFSQPFFVHWDVLLRTRHRSKGLAKSKVQ